MIPRQRRYPMRPMQLPEPIREVRWRTTLHKSGVFGPSKAQGRTADGPWLDLVDVPPLMPAPFITLDNSRRWLPAITQGEMQ